MVKFVTCPINGTFTVYLFQKLPSKPKRNWFHFSVYYYRLNDDVINKLFDKLEKIDSIKLIHFYLSAPNRYWYFISVGAFREKSQFHWKIMLSWACGLLQLSYYLLIYRLVSKSNARSLLYGKCCDTNDTKI